VTFARTKIQPPRQRSVVVERSTLRAQLAEALVARRVVLLCAPAGYGKTTLLAQVTANLPVAWISADAGDDLARVLECMLAALEPFDPPWRTAPEALLTRIGSGSAEEERSVAAEIINTLDACEVAHGVIVFDDVHRIDDPAFFRFLDLLIARMSPRWTIALTARAEPPLSLARLRAADELAEFRQHSLRFAREESRALATAAGLKASLADRMFDRTQGWPAGLRIAIGALRARGADAATDDAAERALRAGDRPMFELLTTEVLGELRPELSEFLLRVSVLPELSADRCTTVSGDPQAAALLDEIERLGLFVEVLDAPVRTLRLHDLLRDALQQRLAFERPALLAELRARAAATEPDPLRRITMLVDAGAYDQAADLVFLHVPSIVVTAGPATAQHVIGQFPASYRERSPDLAYALGVGGWIDWNFASMLDWFERAEKGYAAAGNDERRQMARAYRATVLLARLRLDEGAALLESMDDATLPLPTRIVALNAKSWLALETGRLHAVAPLRGEMVDLLERADRLDLWWHTTPANRIPGLPGMTRPLIRHGEALLRVAGDTPTPLQALGLLLQAWSALWQGRFADARALRERAVEHGQWAGETAAVRSHLITLTAFLNVIDGDTKAAVDAALARVRAFEASYDERGRYALFVVAARIASSCGDARALRGVLDELASIEASHPAVSFAFTKWPLAPIVAHAAWLEGRKDEAVARWQEALAHEEAIDVFGQAAEARVRLARALVHRGDLRSAADVLAPAFERAAVDATPGGALLAFDALVELSACDWRGVLPSAHRAELARWTRLVAEERDAKKPGAPPDAATGAGEPGLTPRELEVLGRIASGDSNKHIARALDLSLHTVKRHVANILGKLDAETRGQAAAWYRSQA
jgi:LuxR family maltose regulon positive regulatory protein